MFCVTINYIILKITSDTFALMFHETQTIPPDVRWKDLAVYEGADFFLKMFLPSIESYRLNATEIAKLKNV